MLKASTVGRAKRARITAFAAALCCLVTLALAQSAAAAGTTTYTSTQTIPIPPASNYAGSAGGDGWALAFTSTQLFNVFHHDSQLQFACHNQVDASACYNPETITDQSGNDFASSAQPGLFLDQSTGKLYVYATRTSDGTGGVVCIDTTVAATNPNPFCGFTALTAVGDAPVGGGISSISDPMMVGTKWYAFNYVDGAGQTGTQNELLCFDTSTDAACSGQPFNVSLPSGTITDGNFPGPSPAAIGNELIIPIQVNGTDTLACFNGSTQSACGGSFPLQPNFGFTGNGAPFPLLSATGVLQGFCLPTGTDQCFDQTGASVATPSNMPSVIGNNQPWNGPAFVLGPRVYVPDFNRQQVECFDYSTNASCTNFPHFLNNLGNLYTVNPDPQRPTCIWVNSDNGASQIQNFDAFSGGACGQGQIRVLASQFIVNQTKCFPASYTKLQIQQPPPSSYTSGTVTFEDGDGNPIPGAPPENLDATGSVSLVGLSLTTATGLPQFVIALNGETGTPGNVVVQLTWQATYDPSCIGSGTNVTPTATSTTTSLSGGGQSGTSITVPAGTAVSDQATVTGTDAAAAGGKITYSVYSDNKCTNLVAGGTAQSIATPGSPPASAPVSLSTPGTYYWVASYGGDPGNMASSSNCGSEVETVSSTVPVGCSVMSTANTAFNSGGQSVHTENNLSSNTSATEHLVLRSLSGAAQYFTLTGVTTAACHDNPANPLATGHQYNTLSLTGTGSYGASQSQAKSGFTIKIEFSDLGAPASTSEQVVFTVTNTSTGAVIWNGVRGTLTGGSEVETG